MTLPDDAGWIFTAPDPAIDSVAEDLGNASDRPVQIVSGLSGRDVEPEHMLEMIHACFQSGPNPVLVLDADLACDVRKIAGAELAHVQDLTST